VSRRTWTLIAVVLGSGIVFLDSTVVNVALPATTAFIWPFVVLRDGSLGALLNDRQLYDRLNKAARNIEQLSRELQPIVDTDHVAPIRASVADAVAELVDELPRAGRIIRATAHEAIKMKKGLIPLIPSKFARAEDGVTIPVSLTQYCVQGETRRGRQTRHGILAADPRIFPLARYVDVFLGKEYLGRYLVDDTGGNVLGATLDIWNPDCREAARFGRHWGSATLVARAVEQIPNDSLVPTRWDGLAKR